MYPWTMRHVLLYVFGKYYLCEQALPPNDEWLQILLYREYWVLVFVHLQCIWQVRERYTWRGSDEFGALELNTSAQRRKSRDRFGFDIRVFISWDQIIFFKINVVFANRLTYKRYMARQCGYSTCFVCTFV